MINSLSIIYKTAIALLLLCPLGACQTKSESSTSESTEKIKKTEIIKENRIEILHRYINAAQKNTLYEIENYSDASFVSRDGVKLDSELIENLYKAARAKLIPADSLYSCRKDENRPEFDIKFKHNSDDFHIISNSHCFNEAPWNISINNKAFVQIDGQFGQALREILTKLNPEKWKNNYKPGIIDFSTPAELPKTWQAQGNLQEALIETLKQNTEIQDLESKFPFETIKIGCSQEESPQCDALLGLIQAKFAERTHYELQIAKTHENWSFTIPPDLENAKKLADSELAEALRKTDPDTFLLQREESTDCDAQRALLPHFVKTPPPTQESCTRWSLSPQPVQNKFTLPPTLVYYPELDAIWIAYSAEVNSDAIFKSYFKAKSTEKYTANDISIFVKIDSKEIIAFKTTGSTSKVLPKNYFNR